MLTKILFTLLVIGLVILVARFRRQPSRPVPAPVRGATHLRLAKGLALAVLAVMLSGSLLMLYLHWRDSHQVLQVKVIDAASGRVSLYRVYRGRLEARGFETLDGRLVRLAETERMEVMEAP